MTRSFSYGLPALLFLGTFSATALDVPFDDGRDVSGPFGDVRSVSSADIDQDGRNDIVGASFADNEIAWWRNIDESGTNWSETVIAPAYTGATFVLTVDLDRDGDLDVLAAGAQAGANVVVFENVPGDGTTWTPRPIKNIFSGDHKSLAVADIDCDGDLDVAGAGSGTNAVVWWQNPGLLGGSWVERIIQANFVDAAAAQTADIDRDGRPDVVASAHTGAGGIAWWRNIETAGQITWALSVISADFTASALGVADIDKNGTVDVAAVTEEDHEVRWWSNIGSNGSTWVEHIIRQAVSIPRQVLLSDLDQDGDPDAVVPSQGSGSVCWYENTGIASNWAMKSVDMSFSGATSVAVADINGDGLLDALGGAAASANRIDWWRNLHIHRSVSFRPTDIATNALGASSIAGVDIDRDGDMDGLVGALGAGMIAYENDGALNPSFTGILLDAVTNTDNVATADFDKDGDPDFVATRATNQLVWYVNQLPGPFSPTVIASNIEVVHDIDTADIDSDGDIDIAVATGATNDRAVVVFRNNGGAPPVFQRLTLKNYAAPVQAIEAVDLDRNGTIDIVASLHDVDPRIEWFSFNGDTNNPMFNVRQIDIGTGASDISIIDVNGDGQYDVATVQSNANLVRWYENDGAVPPVFSPRTVSTNFPGPDTIVTGDIDDDGDVDAVVASKVLDRVEVFVNNGAVLPGWTSVVAVAGILDAEDLFIGDVNSDGDLDVASVSPIENRAVLFDNRGGHFSLPTIDIAPLIGVQGRTNPVLSIAAVHEGRTGDADVELVTLELIFEESAGDPLSSTEANAVIENISVLLDDGDSVLELGIDTVVASVDTLVLNGGRQIVPFADGDPNVQIQHGTPRQYYLVAGLTDQAASQTPNQYRVTHDTESSSTGENSVNDFPLRLKFSENVVSKTTRAVDPNADTDGDGMPDGWEFMNFGDPTNAPPDGNVDGDDMTNLEEYIADTNPNSALSQLQVVAIKRESPAVVIFGVASTSRVYNLEVSIDLTTNTWADVPGQTNVPGLPGITNSLTDVNAATTGNYRIRVDLP